MDELQDDRFAKEIMQNSRLEITTPNFDQLLMRKIAVQSRKRNVNRNILLYVLIFVTIDALLFAILKLLNIDLFRVASGVEDVTNKTSFLVKAFENTITNNHIMVIGIVFIVFLFSVLRGLTSSPRF